MNIERRRNAERNAIRYGISSVIADDTFTLALEQQTIQQQQLIESRQTASGNLPLLDAADLDRAYSRLVNAHKQLSELLNEAQ